VCGTNEVGRTLHERRKDFLAGSQSRLAAVPPPALAETPGLHHWAFWRQQLTMDQVLRE
jgi:hypothetical protein